MQPQNNPSSDCPFQRSGLKILLAVFYKVSVLARLEAAHRIPSRSNNQLLLRFTNTKFPRLFSFMPT